MSDQLREGFEEYARTHDSALRDRLVAAHMGLATYLARRFANRGQPLDDLVQVASLGLLKALERFDPSLDIEFSTYATTTIIGELKRYLRDRGWAVRAPRRMQELYLTLNQVVEPLGQHLGRSPTIAELANEVGASEEEVLEALEAGQAYRFASLDTPHRDSDGGETVSEGLGAEDAELARAEERATLAPLMEVLSDRDRRIVHMRFFESLSQSEISRRIGVSQMQVSRILTRSIAAMRQAADASPPGPKTRRRSGRKGGVR